MKQNIFVRITKIRLFEATTDFVRGLKPTPFLIMGLLSLMMVIILSGCTQSVTTAKTTCKFDDLIKYDPQSVCSIRVNIDLVGGPDWTILSIDGSERVWNTNFKSIISKYSVDDEAIVKTVKGEYKLKIVSDKCGNNIFEYPLERICK